MIFPTWRYFKAETPEGWDGVIVNNESELKALGETWDNPGLVPVKTYREHQAEWDSKEEKKPKKKKA